MSFAVWGAVLAFAVIEGDALLDQSEIGHASILFMLGTACLAAAGCLALFALSRQSAWWSRLHLVKRLCIRNRRSLRRMLGSSCPEGKVGPPPAALAPERSNPAGVPSGPPLGPSR